MWRVGIVSTMVAVITSGISAWADVLPAQNTTSLFGVNYALGYSGGDLYVYTGDSIYKADLSDENNPAFMLHMTGLESAFDGNQRAAEGTMITISGGRALVSMGFTSGGMLAVDLNAQTAQPISAFDTANVYSGAGRSDGAFYVQRALPWPGSPNVVDSLASNGAVTQNVVDPNDLASGGMAFDAAGNLYVGTFDYDTTFTSAVGTTNFYRISAADLADFEANGITPTLQFLGSGASNGNGIIIAANDGLLYFTTTTGIGAFDPVNGTMSNIYGDIVDEGIYGYEFEPLQGLTYDSVSNRLVFAEHVGGGTYALQFLTVPEAAALTLAWLGLAALLQRSITRRF